MKRRLLGLALVIGLGVGGSAVAETLTDTLILAYQRSPILEAQRAALRGTDEGVAVARSGRRPQVNAQANADVSASDSRDYDFRDNYSAALAASLLLYDHGATAAAIRSAQAGVQAGRAQLRSVEQNVLLSAVAAYMDIRRDQQSVTVARNNVSVLEEQVRATRDRFELGEVTRTDVSLAEARLASARANLASFQGALTLSLETYLAVVGVPALNLASPPPIPSLPRSLSEAEAIAMRTHPDLTAARFLEESAQHDLSRARSARGPQVTLDASIARTDNQGQFAGRARDTSVGAGVTASVPLYAGGRLSALVRQAEALLQQRKYQVQDTARLIRQNVASAYSNLAVARATIDANREEVRAARVAFEGVQEEATLGARTTLDVLDLEQDLRDAEFQLASSLRDEYVAAYQVLSSIGLLSVEHLQLGIPVYNPDVNYRRVQHAPYSTVEGGILEQLRDRYSR